MKAIFSSAIFLAVLCSCSIVHAQEGKERPDWRMIKVGTQEFKNTHIVRVVNTLAESSKTPIHLVYSLDMKKLSLELDEDATLGEAVEALRKAVPGLSVTSTGRGILLNVPLPKEAIMPLNRRFTKIDFDGNLELFLGKYIRPAGWIYLPANGAEKIRIRISHKEEIRARDLLVRVSESAGVQFRLGISPEPYRITLRTFPSFNFSGKPTSVSVGKPTRTIAFGFSWYEKTE